ncbi:MAG TPA: DUF3303 family protein [Terracidiphilus sp.]|nr:DUF3303 family protein [Terracidiphilus sp.]
MKYITTWAALPGATAECVEKFFAGDATPEPDVTVLGRWHKVDCSGGFALSETDNPKSIYKFAAKWADVMEIHVDVVIDEADAEPILAAVFKK